MKKLQLLLFLLLIGLWGYWFQLKIEKVEEITPEVAGEKVVDANLEMTFLDIGQGDATLIDFSNGEQMLLDCAIDGRILEALGRNMHFTDKTIDYLVVTHPDLDHYGGCLHVMNRFEVGEVWYTGLKKEHDISWNEWWYAVHDGIRKYREIEAAEQFVIASTTIDILYPDHNVEKDKYIPGEKSEPNANNTSIVMKVTSGNTEVLLTSDAEEVLENYLAKTYGEFLQSDILKMGHHGSDSSSIQPFLDVVQPIDTVVSAGIDNNYGHPSRRVLKRFDRMKTNVYRTDMMGDVTLRIFDGDYVFETQF